MDAEQQSEVRRAYRGWAGSYDQLMRRTYQRVERAISRAHLLERLPRRTDGSVLDTGGGDGRRAIELVGDERAGDAVVLDLSPEMLALARKRVARSGAPVRLCQGDVRRIPFPDDFFDLTVSFGGVVSHCPDFENVIREICRVTRTGGHVVISVDGRAVGIRTARRARRPDLLKKVLTTGTARIFHHHPFPFEVHFFTPEELRGLVESCGARIVSMIGKPVLTHFTKTNEVLSGPAVRERVALAMEFVSDPLFIAHADQIEVVARI